MHETSRESWTLLTVYRALFRFKGRMIGFAVAVILLAVVGLLICPRTYESEAKLLLRVGRESVSLDPTATSTGQVIGLDRPLESEINSVIEVIKSRTILEKVVDAQHGDEPFASPWEREKAIRKLRDKVRASSPDTSSVVVVTLENSRPEQAQSALQSLIDIYLKEHIRVHRTSGSYEFFEQQAAILRGQLEAATVQLRDVKNESGLVSLPERHRSLEEQIGQLETDIRQTESEISGSEAQVAALRDSLDKLPADLVAALAGGDEAIVFLRRQLFELQAHEQDLLSKRTADHPEVIAVREQMSELEAIFNSEKVDHVSGMSAVVLEEESKLKSAQARRTKLREQHEQLTAELRDLNEKEAEISRLQREVELLATNYKTYSESLEKSRVDQALNTEGITNVSVVQPASFQLKPSSPQKGLVLAVAGLLGVCGGLGLALLSEQLDQSLRYGEDVERHLNLPLLSSIPELKSIPTASA